MKKLLALISGILLFATAARAEVNATAAENFIKGVTKTGIEEIINSNVSQQEKDKRFEASLLEDLHARTAQRFYCRLPRVKHQNMVQAF